MTEPIHLLVSTFVTISRAGYCRTEQGKLRQDEIYLYVSQCLIGTEPLSRFTPVRPTIPRLTVDKMCLPEDGIEGRRTWAPLPEHFLLPPPRNDFI